jgi:putative resolvase
VCYARVSSEHQKEDLKKQKQDLGQAYPEYEILLDIGSGINFKCRNLQKLLEQAFNGDFKEVVVIYKDRLCRIGYKLLEFVFNKLDVRVRIMGFIRRKSEREDLYELSEDFLSVLTIFVTRHNPKRVAENRKRRCERATEKETEASSKEAIREEGSDRWEDNSCSLVE